MGGVVSCNEEFERVVSLTAEEWAQKDIELFKVNVGDFNFAPDAYQLKTAAEFINKKVQGTSGIFKTRNKRTNKKLKILCF